MIKTWVLIILIGGQSQPIVVPDYGASAECEQARAIMERWSRNARAVCIPGPVRPN